MQVDSEGYERGNEGGDEETGAGDAGSVGQDGRHRGSGTEFLKVDGEVLERGLVDLVPSLCAYLRGHTEVGEAFQEARIRAGGGVGDGMIFTWFDVGGG